MCHRYEEIRPQKQADAACCKIPLARNGEIKHAAIE